MAVKIPVCWDRTNVGKAISLKAKLDEKQTHYFLACHSPMEHIQDVRAKRVLSEEELYQKIMGSAQRDLQAVVYGNPGTGKSHLIHWLKLRLEFDLQSGTHSDIVPVLIQRRSGSLKDALEQMIDQLGERFEKYFDPVRKAIERISEATARQILVYQLAVELGPGWTDRGREPLTRLLRELGQACSAKGFGGWLCRDGGVIDRTINLLTEASDIKERESRPQFKESDFKIPASFRGSRENALEVLELIDELEDRKALREEAAKAANEALRHAVVDMIGLSGANLRKIFDVIRKDLQENGKRLTLFVEDVSAMADLDVEVVNAVEPQDKMELCPLTAVLGMTRTGFSHLPDNQRGRIEILACVDQGTQRWSHNRHALAHFTARYLNATRLDETDVFAIAKHRQEHGGDVNISKCTACEASKECHARFGKVRIDGSDVGLFPLTAKAPYRMLDRIERDQSSDVSPNQRGLLIHVLSPVLSDVDSITQQRFPYEGTVSIAVSDPIYWTEFTRNYCGGWDDETRRRLRILAELWIEKVDSASEAAKRLTPLLEPFGFPAFSKEVPQSEREPTVEERRKEKGNSRERHEEKADKAAVNKVEPFLQSLSVWKDGGPLSRDADFRRYIADFIRRSISWDSEREPPLSEWKRLLAPGKQAYAFVRIEGQVSHPATQHFFVDQFPRNEETRGLLEALLRFDKQGNRSWDFKGAEHHKRVASSWLRKNGTTVISSVQPKLDLQTPLTSAIQFLCLVATVRTREKVPQSAANLVDTLFSGCWATTPVTLSCRWTELVADMASRHDDVSEFLQRELGVTQGRDARSINFIDPLPMIEVASLFRKQPAIQEVEAGYFDSFWKTRYFDGLRGGLQPYAILADVLEEERAEVGKLVEFATQMLASAGFDTTDVKSAFVSFCQDLEQLVEVRKKNFPWPHAEFDELFKSGVFSENRQRWGFALEKGTRVSSSTDLYDILLFDPQLLKAAADALTVVAAYISQLDHELSLQEAEVKKGRDPRELEGGLLEVLGTIADLAEEDQEVTNVNS